MPSGFSTLEQCRESHEQPHVRMPAAQIGADFGDDLVAI